MPDEAHRKSESIWKTIFWSKLYLHFRASVGRRIWTHVLVGFALSQNTLYTSSITGKATVTFFIMIKAKFLNWVLHLLFLVYTETASILQLDFCCSCSYYSVDVNWCFKIHILGFSNSLYCVEDYCMTICRRAKADNFRENWFSLFHC